MATITIKPELLRVLTQLKLKKFTVAELTKAYLNAENSLHTAPKPARQYVYRNMLRMMKVGLMVKISEDRAWPHYCLTDKFQKIGLQIPQLKPDKKALEKPLKPIRALKERLSKHKSDMLCSMGEAEEYNELCAEHPELSKEAQVLYNEARERSAMLLGKVKALENLLSSHSRV